MEKKDKRSELMKSLQNIKPLDDVPADVSLRFHETLNKLKLDGFSSTPKNNLLTGANRFAFAASFALVFALGAVFAFNSGSNSMDSMTVSGGQSTNSLEENNVKDDQLLYSAGDSSIPKISNSPIKLAISGHDYFDIPDGLQKLLDVGQTWNSVSSLDSPQVRCLKLLELDETTNLIDAGFLGKREIQAIWMPIGSESWNIYLIDTTCKVLEKKVYTK